MQVLFANLPLTRLLMPAACAANSGKAISLSNATVLNGCPDPSWTTLSARPRGMYTGD